MKEKFFLSIIMFLLGGATAFLSGAFLDHNPLRAMIGTTSPTERKEVVLNIEDLPEISIEPSSKEKETPKEEDVLEEKESAPKKEELAKIEINSANKEELQSIVGIGEVTAKSIIDYRKKNPFCSFSDLQNVSGIGEVTLENIKKQNLASVVSPEECKNPSKKELNKENATEELEEILEKLEKIEERIEKLRKRAKKEEVLEIEINSANKEELQNIVGIGEVTAQNIVEYRKKFPFCSLSDLQNVSGIGEVTLENIKKEGVAYAEPLEECKEEVSPSKEVVVEVEINSASREELQDIVGIGEVTAKRIIDYRKKSPFCSLSDLQNVSGIGEVTLENIKKEGIAYAKPHNDCRRSGSSSTSPPPKEENEKEEVREVEINSANKEDLTKITHIGEKRAESIIEKRPFCALSNLVEISGIGKATLEDIKKEGIAYIDPPKKCKEEDLPPEEDEKEEVREVEINSANKEELQNIVGIGEVTAQNIVEYRKKNPFCSFSDLQNVSGIGEVTLENIKKEGIAYVDPPEKCKEEDLPPDEEEIEMEVEINSANKEKLQNVSGIGEVTAKRIIDYRKKSPFCSLSDLQNVSGIGEATLENIKKEGVAYVKPLEECKEEVSPPKEEEIEIEINSANKEELTKITHIGEKRAESIIEKRPFCSLDDLVEISGIGETTLEDIKEEGIAYVDSPENCFNEEN